MVPDHHPLALPDESLAVLAADIAARVCLVVRAELGPGPAPSLVPGVAREHVGAPPLLDLSAVARWLNVSERLIETFVAAGEIPCLRIGQGRGVRRFEPAAVEAFIRRQAAGPSARRADTQARGRNRQAT